MMQNNQYYIYRGCINNVWVGSGNLIYARGPKTAMRLLFPGKHWIKAKFKDIFGCNITVPVKKDRILYQGNSILKSDWVQINFVDNSEAYYFIFE